MTGETKFEELIILKLVKREMEIPILVYYPLDL